jgi:hypothetical protein
MTRNEGGIDRTLRVIVGLAVLSLYFLLDAPAKYWGLVGIVPFATGVVGWCPLYSLIGVTTCPFNTRSR